MKDKIKEPLAVPVVDCGSFKIYLTYTGMDELDYSGKIWHNGRYIDGDWKKEKAEDFEDTLRAIEVERGRSAARIVLESLTNGNIYSMFLSDFFEMLLKNDLHKGIFAGRFTHVKKGSNYGIKWIGEPRENGV